LEHDGLKGYNLKAGCERVGLFLEKKLRETRGGEGRITTVINTKNRSLAKIKIEGNATPLDSLHECRKSNWPFVTEGALGNVVKRAHCVTCIWPSFGYVGQRCK